MARPVDKDKGLRLRITWDSTKGSCASRFQDLTSTLANWLWSAVCHVLPTLLGLWVSGTEAAGSSPRYSRPLPCPGSHLAKAEGRQAMPTVCRVVRPPS